MWFEIFKDILPKNSVQLLPKSKKKRKEKKPQKIIQVCEKERKKLKNSKEKTKYNFCVVKKSGQTSFTPPF